MEREILEFIETYIRAIKEDSAAIFAGAGLSVNAGYLNWKELMRDIAEELGLDVDKETDLIELAQFYRNSKSGRGSINQKLIDEFTKDAVISENHKLLAKLPIKTFWTTNYDNLIEKALEQSGKTVDAKLTSDSLSYAKKGRDAIIYKMHGDISLPNDAVLTKDDYESYNEKRQMFTTALQGDLVSKTFLFWGFSFNDPNLEYILSRIRILLGESRRDHYCFFKTISKKDFADDAGNVNNEEYVYACTKQQLKIQDLKRYSIQALLVEDYNEITDIFKIIYMRLKEDTVFISGAANVFQPWEKEIAEKFVYELSKRIAENGMKVISGFGSGIGSSVINGVLSYVYSAHGAKMDDYLVLKPFPQNIADFEKRKKLWNNYRKDMLSEAGIAIFMFGNKLENGTVINSSGMMEEFNLAVENDTVIIPLGCTGYISKVIWDKVMEEPQKYYGNIEKLIENIEKLGEEDISDYENLIRIILETIKIIRDKRRKRL